MSKGWQILGVCAVVFGLQIPHAYAFKKITGCLDPARVDQIMRRFKTINMGENLQRCNPANRTYQVLYTLDFIDKLKLEGPPPPAPFNQNILPGNWLDWMAANGEQIRFGPTDRDPDPRVEGQCDRVPGAFALRGTGKVFLCSFSPEPTEGDILKLVEHLLHEARHASPRNSKGHDERGRDLKVTDKGAHAVGMEAMAKIAMNAVNVSSEMRDAARARATELGTDTYFKQPPLKTTRHPVLLLRSENGRNFLYNHEFLSEEFTDLPAGKIGFDSSYLMTLVPADATWPILLVNIANTHRPDYISTAGPSSDNVQNSRADFADLFNKAGGPKKGSSTPYRITALAAADRIEIEMYHAHAPLEEFKVKLPRGRPIHLRGAVDGSTHTYDNVIYALNEYDQLFSIRLEPGRPPVTVEVDNPYRGFRSVSRIGDKIYLVNVDGELYEKNAGNPRAPVLRIERLKGERFYAVSQPFTYRRQWAKELDPPASAVDGQQLSVTIGNH